MGKLKIILFVSIAINILLIGLTFGYFSRGIGLRPPPFKTPPMIAEKLTPNQRKVFSETMGSLRMENREIRQKIRQTRGEALEILTAPKFDAKAYETKMKELRQLQGEMKTKMTQKVLELAPKLSQEERKALASYLERGHRGGGPGGPPPHKRGGGQRRRAPQFDSDFRGPPPPGTQLPETRPQD